MAFLLLSVSLSVSRFTVSVVFFVGLRFYCVTIKVKFYWVQDHKNRIEHKDKLSVQRTHIESCRRTNKRKNGRVGGRRWDSGHVLVKNLQLYSVELCVCVCALCIRQCDTIEHIFRFRWMRDELCYRITGKKSYSYSHFSHSFVLVYCKSFVSFLGQNGQTRNISENSSTEIIPYIA